MDKIHIIGGQPIKGQVKLSGAKNAALPLIAASLLTDQELVLENVPDLADIQTLERLLVELGTKVTLEKKPLDDSFSATRLTLQAKNLNELIAPYALVRKMRASVLVLGPILSRFGKAQVSLPGGCAIGARPINLHLMALEKMGADIHLDKGYVFAHSPGRLKGAEIEFPKISVGATENTLMAAALAQGTTILKNPALEPEVMDLVRCLRKMGADIELNKQNEFVIEGKDTLQGTRHHVVGDRIEAGTYAIAAGITGGELLITNGQIDIGEAVIETLYHSGLDISVDHNTIHVKRNNGDLKPQKIITAPYPGFPTDLQAQMMALLSVSRGKSVIEERIFENRFMHVPELLRMGAKIDLSGSTANIEGVESLKGAEVMATDLRASVSLVLAGLAAEGETIVNRVYHLDRGYESLERKLTQCGAKIERLISY